MKGEGSGAIKRIAAKDTIALRDNATVPFYRALGFTESGDTFSLPQDSDALYIRMQHRLR